MRIEQLKTITTVNEQTRQSGLQPVIDTALSRLEDMRPILKQTILGLVESGELDRRIRMAEAFSLRRGRTNPNSELSDGAGAYFLNEDIFRQVFMATMTDVTLERLSLGPGVSLVEPPSFYARLLQIGQSISSLAVNYTAEGGTAPTTRAIKQIMDAKIDPRGDFFSEEAVYLTQGATESIEIFMEMLAQTNPQAEVLFLGLSYYTGPYAALQKGLQIARAVPQTIVISEQTRFFPSYEEVESALTPNTKAIALTLPNNPTGETYSDEEIRKILTLAKQRNILILLDCIFENLYFDDSRNYQSRFLQIAQELGALDRVVIADSLSKTQNIPGTRIGFLATTNGELKERLDNIIVARRCNPPLVEQPLIQFEGLARKIKAVRMQNPSLSLEKAIQTYMARDAYPFTADEFREMYGEWDNWNDTVKQYYADNLKIVKVVLQQVAQAGSPDEAAFNTFIKLAGIPLGTNSNDFLAKLMFTLSTYTQNGACFGLSQSQWDQYLGMWVRITYASNREELIEGLIRLIVFTEQYIELGLGDSSKYAVLPNNYERQI